MALALANGLTGMARLPAQHSFSLLRLRLLLRRALLVLPACNSASNVRTITLPVLHRLCTGTVCSMPAPSFSFSCPARRDSSSSSASAAAAPSLFVFVPSNIGEHAAFGAQHRSVDRARSRLRAPCPRPASACLPASRSPGSGQTSGRLARHARRPVAWQPVRNGPSRQPPAHEAASLASPASPVSFPCPASQEIVFCNQSWIINHVHGARKCSLLLSSCWQEPRAGLPEPGSPSSSTSSGNKTCSCH